MRDPIAINSLFDAANCERVLPEENRLLSTLVYVVMLAPAMLVSRSVFSGLGYQRPFENPGHRHRTIV